jgi:hypothetical protein
MLEREPNALSLLSCMFITTFDRELITFFLLGVFSEQKPYMISSISP